MRLALVSHQIALCIDYTLTIEQSTHEVNTMLTAYDQNKYIDVANNEMIFPTPWPVRFTTRDCINDNDIASGRFLEAGVENEICDYITSHLQRNDNNAVVVQNEEGDFWAIWKCVDKYCYQKLPLDKTNSLFTNEDIEWILQCAII
jgi:hypothetical protein